MFNVDPLISELSSNRRCSDKLNVWVYPIDEYIVSMQYIINVFGQQYFFEILEPKYTEK